MVFDLLTASLLSLALGITSLELWNAVGLPDFLGLLGMALSIAAGPYYLWRRGREPIVPIASIYSVLMFFAILFVYFAIAFWAGRVDL